MSAIKFTILGEPASKSNQRKLVSFHGRPALIKSEKALQYERTVTQQIPASARQMINEPVSVTMHIFYASERPDLDASLILDCLQARYKRFKGPLEELREGEYRYSKGERKLIERGVYTNDRLVRELHLFHHIDKLNPRTLIEVDLINPSLLQQVAA